jgi:Flp pilus assembly pilin Flp
MKRNGGSRDPRDLISFPESKRAKKSAALGRTFRMLGRLGKSFLRDESGQGVIEYILLLSVMVIGAGLLARGILNALDSGVLKLGGQLEKDLKTGRAPLSVYQN